MGNTRPLLEYLEAQLEHIDRRNQIGAQIRAARVATGMEQKEFAHSVGISNTFLNNIEAGRVWPSANTMISIINYLSQGDEDAQDQDEELS